MIRVKDEGNLYVFLYECYYSILDDIQFGYIILNCTEDYFRNNIMRAKRYYDEKHRRG